MHGMGDSATGKDMLAIKALLEQDLHVDVFTIAVNGPATYFDTMDKQVDHFTELVKKEDALAGGFNAIGFSQGSLVIRAYVQRCNDPPVKRFMSMHGPMAGVATLPQCDDGGSACKRVHFLVGVGVYSSFVQSHLAQANYYRDPLRLERYRKAAAFLPDLNKERGGYGGGYGVDTSDPGYRERFASLERLVLVRAQNDTMVVPAESEWFGFSQDGSMEAVWGMRETPWFASDAFGLRTLDTAGRVALVSTPGDHLEFTAAELLDLVRTHFGRSEKEAAAAPLQEQSVPPPLVRSVPPPPPSPPVEAAQVLAWPPASRPLQALVAVGAAGGEIAERQEAAVRTFLRNAQPAAPLVQ
ncbi:unnamed protein product [Phaeothamnion confervicola]